LLRHRLGAELRRLREERSLRLEDVCARLGVAPSTLSRIETGKAPTRTVYLSMLLDLYRVDDPDQRRTLADLARQGKRKGWWTDYKEFLPAGLGNYLGLEASATQVCSYSAQVVPGLLQVKRYAAAACRAAYPGLNASQVRTLVTVQIRRREHLRTGCQLHLVIEEAALLRRIGSADVTATQLEHLLIAAADPAVTIQVARLAATRTVLSPPFTMLTFTQPTGPAVAWSHGLSGHTMVTTCQRDVAAATSRLAAIRRMAMPPAESIDLISELIQHGTGSPHTATGGTR
jgi:transcriptional regulator with XRE-family HTH domain